MWRAHGDDSFSLIYIYIQNRNTHCGYWVRTGRVFAERWAQSCCQSYLNPKPNRQGNGPAVVFSGAFATIGRSCRRDRRDFQDNAESTQYHIVKSYKGMKNTTYPKLLRYWHNDGKLPIYRCFMMIYLFATLIFSSYLQLPGGEDQTSPRSVGFRSVGI